MAQDRLEGITVYLAKKGLSQTAELIKNAAQLKIFVIKDAAGTLGALYVETRAPKAPRWAKFFSPQVHPSKLGQVSATSAVLHATVDGRDLLLTFGLGRHLLQPGCWEDRFGLRVTLNSIGERNVRSIDKHTLDTIGLHTKVQVSKEAPPSEFGLDIERDLLRAVTGSPIDPTLGNTLSGFDSLHASARVSLDTLRQLLSRYVSKFDEDTYKTTFPWVDHISDVRDPILKEKLDAGMMACIAKGGSDKCWLAVPEPVEWRRIVGFRYGGSAKLPLHHDIHIETFFQDRKLDPATVTLDQLAQADVRAVDGEGAVQYKWPAYRCFYCEVELDQDTYLLSDGRWYKVASDFVQQVNAAYEGIPQYQVELPEYDDASETAYNKRLAKAEPGQFALMDAKVIQVGGGYSKVEFCDLMNKARDLIHIKRYGGSGVLSHLFSQGVVSGQLFMQDRTFRKAANDLLPAAYKFPGGDARPDPKAYRIVFAIVSAEKGSALTLPFFSRLSLRNATETLRGYDFPIALAKIRVAEVLKKKKVYKAPNKKK